MSNKSENILVWGEVIAMLIVMGLIGGWSYVQDGVTPLAHLLGEKLFDIALALVGTLFGYWIAKRHIEHLMAHVIKTMDAKYANIFRERAFHKAVSAMLPELPSFYLRKTSTFSNQTVDAVGEFTQWSVQLDPTHTPDKSMEMVGKEAYTLAAKLIEKDMGFKEAASAGNYEWIVTIGNLPPDGWAIKNAPDFSIYDWNTGVAVER